MVFDVPLSLVNAAFDSESVIKALNATRVEIVGSKLAFMGSLAAVIGGMFAAFVLLKLAHDYMSGQGLTIWSVLRPFVILLCICNFNSFVVTPLHGICNIFTNGMMKTTRYSAGQYFGSMMKMVRGSGSTQVKQAGDMWQQSIGTYAGSGDSNQSFVSDFVGAAGLGDTGTGLSLVQLGDLVKQTSDAVNDNMAGARLVMMQQEKEASKGWLSKTFGGLVSGVVEATYNFTHPRATISDWLGYLAFDVILNSILLFLLKIFILGQICYCYVYLILLALLGPFAFSFAIFPSFGKSIQSWIARYVQIAFWIPVGQLVLFINYRIMNSFALIDLGYEKGGMWVLIICTMISILNVFAVPKICAYVIDSTGANDVHNTAGRAVASGAGYAAKAATLIK